MELLSSPSKVMTTLYLANTIYPFKIKCKDPSLSLTVDQEQVVMLDENSMVILESGRVYSINKASKPVNTHKEFLTLKRRGKDEMKKSKSTTILNDKMTLKRHTLEESSLLLTCLKLPALNGHLYWVDDKIGDKKEIQLGFSHNVLRLFYLDKLSEPYDAYAICNSVNAYIDQENLKMFNIVFPRATLKFEALTRHQASIWVALINTASLYLTILEESFHIDVTVLEKTFAHIAKQKESFAIPAQRELEILNLYLNNYDMPDKPFLDLTSPNAYDYFTILPSPLDKTKDSPVQGSQALDVLVNGAPLTSDEILTSKNSEKLLSRLSSMMSEDQYRPTPNMSMKNSASGIEMRTATIDEDEISPQLLFKLQTKNRLSSNKYELPSPTPVVSSLENMVSKNDPNQRQEVLKILQLFSDERDLDFITSFDSLQQEKVEVEFTSNTLIKTPKIDYLGRPMIVYVMESDEYRIKCCSIDILIEQIANAESTADEKWLWLSFLTNPIYIQSTTLFKKLIARINLEKDKISDPDLFNIRVRLLRAVFQWYEWFPYDFQNTEMELLYNSFLKLIPCQIHDQYSRLLTIPSVKMQYIFNKKVLTITYLAQDSS